MPASVFERIELPKLLMGEGRDETRFFESLLRHLGINDVQVEEYGGKQKLGRFVRSLPRFPGFARLQTLAITRDADDDPAAARQSVESAIANANLPAELRICSLVIPPNEESGALESLCVRAVAHQRIGHCIEEFLMCAASAGFGQQWSVGNAAKARAQAWLSVQSTPGMRLGEAAQAGEIDWSLPAFDALKDFLRNL